MFNYSINRRFVTKNSFAGNGRGPYNSPGSDLLSSLPAPRGGARLFLSARSRGSRRLSAVFFILCFFFIFLTGCTDFMGEDWIEARNIPEVDDSKIISDYDLQSYVPAPVEGQEALLFLIQGNLELTAAWRDDEGEKTDSFAFTGGVVYQADITIKTKNGYTFDPEKSFKYYTSPVGDQPEDDFDTALRKLSVTYLPVPATEQDRKKLISNYDLQDYVPVPVTREIPVKSLKRGDMFVEVSWKEKGNSTELPDTFNSFKDNTEYQAEITLTVNNDYFFDPNMVFYYSQGVVAGQDIIEPVEPPELVRKLAVTYNCTEKATMIGGPDDGSISLDVIPHPMAGNLPPSIVNDPDGKYTGVILWYPPDDTFIAGTGYTATVMLFTGPGYVFDKGWAFSHPSVTPTSSPTDGTIVVVTLSFLTTLPAD